MGERSCVKRACVHRGVSHPRQYLWGKRPNESLDQCLASNDQSSQLFSHLITWSLKQAKLASPPPWSSGTRFMHLASMLAPRQPGILHRKNSSHLPPSLSSPLSPSLSPSLPPVLMNTGLQAGCCCYCGGNAKSIPTSFSSICHYSAWYNLDIRLGGERREWEEANGCIPGVRLTSVLLKF